MLRLVEDVLRTADHASLEPVGRRRASHDPHLRIDLLQPREECPVHPLAIRRDKVALVDDAHVPMADLLYPAEDRLDAAHHHRAVRLPSIQPCRADAHADVWRDEPYLLGVLLQQFFRARDHERASIPRLDCVRGNLPQHPAFARADGHLHARVRVLVPQMFVNSPYGVLLVVSKSHSCFFFPMFILVLPSVPQPAPRRRVRSSPREALLSASRRASCRRVQANRGEI